MYVYMSALWGNSNLINITKLFHNYLDTINYLTWYTILPFLQKCPLPMCAHVYISYISMG